MGNFDVPFDRKTFPSIEKAVVAISKYDHPDVFGESRKPSAKTEQKVIDYIEGILNR